MNTTTDLETLWHEHHAKMLNYVKQRVPVDAEDVAQDVWLSVVEAMQRDNGAHTHASGWLYRIARNRMIDGYRSRSRQPQWSWLDEPIDDDEKRTLADTLVCEDAGPHELTERALDMVVLASALPVLTDDQRQVIRLTLDGYDYSEISEMTHNSYESVKALRNRAIVRLRPYFDAAYVAPMRNPRKPRRDGMSPLAATVRDTLMAHGPLLASSIAQLSGTMAQSVNNAVNRHRHVFVIVSYQQCYGYLAKVWGVRGVHDSQGAV